MAEKLVCKYCGDTITGDYTFDPLNQIFHGPSLKEWTKQNPGEENLPSFNPKEVRGMPENKRMCLIYQLRSIQLDLYRQPMISL